MAGVSCMDYHPRWFMIAAYRAAGEVGTLWSLGVETLHLTQVPNPFPSTMYYFLDELLTASSRTHLALAVQIRFKLRPKAGQAGGKPVRSLC